MKIKSQSLSIAYFAISLCLVFSLFSQSSSETDLQEKLVKYQEEASVIKEKQSPLDQNDQQEIQKLNKMITLLKESLNLNQVSTDSVLKTNSFRLSIKNLLSGTLRWRNPDIQSNYKIDKIQVLS